MNIWGSLFFEATKAVAKKTLSEKTYKNTSTFLTVIATIVSLIMIGYFLFFFFAFRGYKGG